MDELIITDINADMGIGLAVSIEENQVAGVNIIYGDLRQRLSHALDSSRQRYALMLVDMLNKAAAIETFLRRSLAIAVRGALQAQCVIDCCRVFYDLLGSAA